MKKLNILHFSLVIFSVLLTFVFVPKSSAEISPIYSSFPDELNLNIDQLKPLAPTATVETFISIDVKEYQEANQLLILNAYFDYTNADGLLRDFDASSKQDVTNFTYSWEGSGTCADVTPVSFQCDGIITRLTVSYDYTQTVDPQSFDVGAGINVPNATITGSIEMFYPTTIFFVNSALLEPVTHMPGKLTWQGTADNALGVYVTFSTVGWQSCGSVADSDEDGLYDGWEICGYYANGYQSDAEPDVDLSAMGADPFHKDIFIEVDYMMAGPEEERDHRPLPDAISRIVTSFAQAPVNNPDGTTGIHLHVDYGKDAPLTYGDADTWDALSRSNDISHEEYLGSCPNDDEFNWNEFNSIRGQDTENNFLSSRHSIFHYNLWIHNLCPEKPSYLGFSHNITGRIGEGASDFVVALGMPNRAPIYISYLQSGTFMHELGHNLGLRHGGGDGRNYKPNYLSVMNYSFAQRGLIINSTDGNFDYSRFELPTLNESLLIESHGINLPDSINDVYGTAWFCNGVGLIDLNASEVDWNCNGFILPALMGEDLNKDGWQTSLNGYDDWANIVFKGGVIGALDGGPPLPETTIMEEITQEDIDLIPTVSQVFLPSILR